MCIRDRLASLPDETPEGRSVVILAKEKFGIRGRNLSENHMEFIPFTAKTRMSGVNIKDSEIRKGAADSMKEYVTAHGGIYSKECDEAVKKIANQGGTPLVVAKDHIILGVIPVSYTHLDVYKRQPWNRNGLNSPWKRNRCAAISCAAYPMICARP